MWDPGFHPAERAVARLSGYARRFCLRSVRYRGTEAAPGLVLALDADDAADCRGLALRIPRDQHVEVMQYIRARELVTYAYQEVILPIELDDGRQVKAYSYVTRRDHAQYAGGLDLDAQAQIIAAAAGCNGPNADYLFNTIDHLSQIGLEDAMLADLSSRVRQLLKATPQTELQKN